MYAGCNKSEAVLAHRTARVSGAQPDEQSFDHTPTCSCRTPITVAPAAMPNTAQKKTEGSSAKELTLRLVGTATTRVYLEGQRDTFGRTEYSEDSDEFLSYEVQLACFDRKATTGIHNFPFSIMLPPGLYPSMKVRKDAGNG